MLGDKLKLLMGELPSEYFTMDVTASGNVVVRYNNRHTGVRGRFDFHENSDMEFIKMVLKTLGFKEEE